MGSVAQDNEKGIQGVGKGSQVTRAGEGSLGWPGDQAGTGQGGGEELGWHHKALDAKLGWTGFLWGFRLQWLGWGRWVGEQGEVCGLPWGHRPCGTSVLGSQLPGCGSSSPEEGSR